MKKVLLSLLLVLPVMANASSLEFNAIGNNFKFNNYGINPNTTGARDIGQFGSFSIVGNRGGTFSATYLGQESGYANNYKQILSLGSQVMDESHLGSTVSAHAGPGVVNFGFASGYAGHYYGEFDNGEKAQKTLGFVVLKEFINKPSKTQIKNAGYNNHTTFGDFDFLIGFNDKAPVDADYDDYVVGIKFVPSPVPLPAALPLMATAIGLFGFGANRRRV